MARRGLTGQLNMFDLLGSADMGEPGEVEMVSLVPNFDEPEETPEVEEIPVIEELPVVEEVPAVVEAPVVEEEEEELQVTIEPSVDDKVAMSRIYKVAGESVEIAYINYNKVRITRGKNAPVIKEFESSKEAVDYYVEQMQEYEIDE